MVLWSRDAVCSANGHIFRTRTLPTDSRELDRLDHSQVDIPYKNGDGDGDDVVSLRSAVKWSAHLAKASACGDVDKVRNRT